MGLDKIDEEVRVRRRVAELIGGEVTALVRESRWRPSWVAEVERDGKRLPPATWGLTWTMRSCRDCGMSWVTAEAGKGTGADEARPERDCGARPDETDSAISFIGWSQRFHNLAALPLRNLAPATGPNCSYMSLSISLV